MNNTCQVCDYKDLCHKKLKFDDKEVLAKEQEVIDMPCRCMVQEICKDCARYLNKNCVAWFMVNGEKGEGRLVRCPKKVK